MKPNTIHHEGCLETMARMPDNFIDLTVTSPPYDNLRDYGKHAWDFEMFQGVAGELYRVTKEGGVVVWVVNDQTKDSDESGTAFRQALRFKEGGFKLFDTMIYAKPAMARKYKQYIQAFEYMFVFSKGNLKTINKIKDRKNVHGGLVHIIPTTRHKDGRLSTKTKQVVRKKIAEYGYRTNIWFYHQGRYHTTKDTFAFDHPAMFPEALVADHISSWSNPGDLVYDPFLGSGTTAKMAYQLGRKYIGSEIHQPYVEIAERRLKIAQTRLAL